MLLVAGNPVTLEEMKKGCENIDNLSHAHKTGVLRSTSVFLNMGIPFTLGFLQKQ